MSKEALFIRRRRSVAIIFVGVLTSLLVSKSLLAGGREEILRELSHLEQTKGWKIVYTDGMDLRSYSISERKDKLLLARDHALEDYQAPTLSPKADRILIGYAKRASLRAVPDFVEFQFRDLKGKLIEAILRVDDVGSAAWSPDGTKIAFTGRDKDVAPASREEVESKDDSVSASLLLFWKDSSLFLLDLTTRRVEKLVAGNVSEVSSTQAWSPDSKGFLYHTVDRKLMMMDLETRTSRVLVDGAWDGSWSRTGDWIAFQDAMGKTNQESHYYLIKPDGTGKRLFIDNSKRAGAWWTFLGVTGPLLWSPDDRFILFTRAVAGLSPHDVLYVMRASDRKEIKLGELAVGGDFMHGSWAGQR